MTTVSLFRGRPGTYVGDGFVHPAVVDAARESVADARGAGRVADAFVSRCGPTVALVLSHRSSAEAAEVAEEAMAAAADVARRLGQHGASSRPVVPHGPSMTLTERDSEPVLAFMAVGAAGAAWNLPLFRLFAVPGPRSGEGQAPGGGFGFVVGGAAFDVPEQAPALAARLGEACAVVEAVESRRSGQPAAAASAGADPALLVRCHGEFPSVDAVLGVFASPLVVAGPAGTVPLMPVSANDDASSPAGGPARVVGFGFQVVAGKLVGPRDLLGDRGFEGVRQQAVAVSDFLRRASS